MRPRRDLMWIVNLHLTGRVPYGTKCANANQELPTCRPDGTCITCTLRHYPYVVPPGLLHNFFRFLFYSKRSLAHIIMDHFATLAMFFQLRENEAVNLSFDVVRVKQVNVGAGIQTEINRQFGVLPVLFDLFDHTKCRRGHENEGRT